jgi:uncharacterized protein YbjQ (UPF0145 family)
MQIDNIEYKISFIYLCKKINYYMDKSFITTAFSFEGCTISKNLGVVRGIIVRSRNIFANIGAGFQTLVGGDITLYTELCEKTRADAFDLMVRHAEEVGANAIVGMRYDANEIASGVTEVLAYGTAVVVERKMN